MGIRLNDIADKGVRNRIAAALAAQACQRLCVPVPAADVEQGAGHEAPAQASPQTRHERVVLHIHSIRHRLADPDGLCAKWLIDSLVDAEILADDTAEDIQEVRFSQEKTSEAHPTETTIVTIEEVQPPPPSTLKKRPRRPGG